MKTKSVLPIRAAKLFVFLSLVLFYGHLKAQPLISFNQVAGNLNQPLEIKNAGDGSGRLFIAEQGGLIKIYKNGNILSKPFLNISSLVAVGQFQGIWSIAFSPAYATDRNFFILYSDKKGTTAVAKYKVSATNPDSADPKSAVIILSYPKAGSGHYGSLAFGNDNDLYISLGAGGNNKNSQNGQSYFGKMLRINVNVNTAPYYSIPTDNPFINSTSILHEVWATGLRNAWRWSFDKNNYDMWIADVGQDSMEEVDYRTPAQGLTGSNFGWQCYEGTEVYKRNGCGNINNYVFPVFEYHHDIPTGGECLIGGYVYRGSTYPILNGYYICADFVSDNLWEIISNGAGGFTSYLQKKATPGGINSFGEAENGELYAVSNQTGALYSISATAPVASGTVSSPVLSANAMHSKSVAYPTMVTNGSITLDLKEAYQSVKITDMAGHSVFTQQLAGVPGTITLLLPRLTAGIYILSCTGPQVFQQKIYIQ